MNSDSACSEPISFRLRGSPSRFRLRGALSISVGAEPLLPQFPHVRSQRVSINQRAAVLLVYARTLDNTLAFTALALGGCVGGYTSRCRTMPVFSPPLHSRCLLSLHFRAPHACERFWRGVVG